LASVSSVLDGNKCSVRPAGDQRIDQFIDAARAGHMSDLEGADGECAIAQQAAEQRLLQLQRVDRPEVHCGGAAAGDVSEENEDFFRRHGEDRAVPQPDRAERDQRARCEQNRAQHRESRREGETD
jgi:hypothetical protein